MKKILKYLIVFIVMFSFCLIVDALDDEVRKAKEAMEKYCEQDVQGLKGCIYDSNDSMYTNSGKVPYYQLSNFLFESPSIELTKGYVSANGKGEMIFAGCYKGHHNGDDKVGEGDYFIFNIISSDGKECKKIESDIIFAEGIKFKASTFSDNMDGIFSGKPMGSAIAKYDDWKATNGGECPKAFGLTANSNWYTSDEHKYVFTNKMDRLDTGVYSFGFFGIGKEEYITTQGCTVQDKKSYEEAKACYDKAAAVINSKECPSDYSEFSKLSKELESLQDDCDFDELSSKGHLKDKADEFSNNLITAINNKLNSCQSDRCDIKYYQLQEIERNLNKEEYKLCKSGKCPAGIYNSQSTSKNAKCYKIGSGTSAFYEWADKPSGALAIEVKNISKLECYGTEDTRNCRNCLKNVYIKAGLNDKQINCMLEQEIEKSSVMAQVEEDIKKQFEDGINEELKESQEIRDKAYENLEPKMPTEDPNLNTCEKVLGPNLTKLLKVSITIIQVVAAIIAIVKGMMTLIPPIIAKDADALKKASKTLVTMAIILVIIFLFRPIFRFLGSILNFDTSCI